MKAQRKFDWGSFACAILAWQAPQPAPAGADASRLAAPPVQALAELRQRIDTFLRGAVERGFHGSVLVRRGGDLVLDAGYGLRDREKGLPNGPQTVHAIGSITKQFTAAAVLELAEQKKLSVGDPLERHFKDVPEDKRGITLHQLLTHSAGFPGAIGDDYAPVEREEFVRLALATPLRFAPGSAYEYSNVGYSLLGAIVEQSSGKSYEAFLQEALLAPAGLTHTGYSAPDWTQHELAIGYAKGGARWGTMLDKPWAKDGPFWHLRCNGGLLSTTHDMLRWVDALEQHEVLQPESVRAMFAPHVAEGEGAQSHYGYGWAIFPTRRGTRLITHNGGNGVQFADVLHFADEGVSIVLLSNASARGMQDMAWEIGRACFDPAYEPRLPKPARQLPGLPAGAVGERLQALSTLIGSAPAEADLRRWLEANLGPGFLSDFGMQQHLAVFQRLIRDIGAHRIDGVQDLGEEEFELRLVADGERGTFRLRMQLRPSDARIAGMAVERE